VNALDAFADAIAERVAARVAERLASRGPAEDLLGEADLVPRFFRTARAMRDAVRRGDLAASRAGRALIVNRTDLEAYLSARPRRPTRRVRPDAHATDDATLLAAAGLRLVPGGRK
jgi:hypothetical protein